MSPRNDCGEYERQELGVELDKSYPHRKADESRYIVNVEPLHQLTSVSFDRFDAQVQALSDVFRRLPFCDELQDFSLTHAEPCQWAGGPF